MSNPKNLGERPRCPECNEPNPSSLGPVWRCLKCGRSWHKIKRTEKVEEENFIPQAYLVAIYDIEHDYSEGMKFALEHNHPERYPNIELIRKEKLEKLRRRFPNIKESD